MMDLDAIRNHWREWAVRFATDLRATTKTVTIKQLEIDALSRAIGVTSLAGREGAALEVGCGNGLNCLTLARMFPRLRFTGVDYVPDMVQSANQMLAAEPALAGRVEFRIGNAMELGSDQGLAADYDLVFSDRMVINLNTWALQSQVLDQLVAKVAPGGSLMLIENFSGCHARQNELRSSVGLPRRQPAPFNLFLDETQFEEYLERRLRLVAREDFAALHDLLLYVLTPLVNDGQVDYASPLVRAATDLCLANGGRLRQGEGGQNRLYVFLRGPT